MNFEKQVRKNRVSISCFFVSLISESLLRLHSKLVLLRDLESPTNHQVLRISQQIDLIFHHHSPQSSSVQKREDDFQTRYQHGTPLEFHSKSTHVHPCNKPRKALSSQILMKLRPWLLHTYEDGYPSSASPIVQECSRTSRNFER